jgi:CheY-like chemotaxis protein
VEARSEGPGRGSEFVIHLPLTEDPARPAPPEHGAPDAALALPERVRVLVADDNHDAAESLAMMLSLLGADTQAVFDGQQALEAASTFRPQLAILDLGMPQLGGLEVARLIRAEEWGQGMVLAALTGWGQDEDRQRVLEAGFDHHLVKPVDGNAIQRLLSETAARSR